ncbi:hypothetical protein CBR_g51926 [Chara braunii]|uniref:Uncharacterized protein n=1 Tax=Chara braunii TaxID=69332 RepID=A0A388M963_CHABU|nr:hypothetical protein CBR_g51926 [Chara braunii]|eukprot:GBG91124.1 hypothetical protein CBR_g51926 [Chara braunii]
MAGERLFARLLLLVFLLVAQLSGLLFLEKQQAMVVASELAVTADTPIAAVAPKDAVPGDLPMPFTCKTTTSCKIMMNASNVKSYNGKDRDKIIVDIAGQGPCYWSISRFNRGDLSPRLSPRHPFAQPNLGVLPTGDNGFETSDPKHFSVQAWKPHVKKGVVLVSVAQNGELWPDGESFFYGTAAAVMESSGYGYSLVDGGFSGEEAGAIDVTVGKAGRDEEANIDVAVAWFPYSQGWVGGYVDAPQEMSAKWSEEGSHSPQLPTDVKKLVSFNELEGAEITLPGVNGRHDGMLFVTSTDPSHGNSAVNLAQLCPVKKLIGGHVNGHTGLKLHGEGKFDVKRLAFGMYEITIDSSPKTDGDGILLLQVVDEVAKNKRAPKCFLSYNYTKAGSLIVESHEVDYTRPLNDQFPFCETSFYFMWVDFRSPVSPPQNLGTGATDSPQGDYFGIGFFLGMVMTVAMIVASYVVMKHLYNAPPGPSMIALEDIGDDELETGLLDSVDASERDRDAVA